MSHVLELFLWFPNAIRDLILQFFSKSEIKYLLQQDLQLCELPDLENSEIVLQYLKTNWKRMMNAKPFAQWTDVRWKFDFGEQGMTALMCACNSSCEPLHPCHARISFSDVCKLQEYAGYHANRALCLWLAHITASRFFIIGAVRAKNIQFVQWLQARLKNVALIDSQAVLVGIETQNLSMLEFLFPQCAVSEYQAWERAVTTNNLNVFDWLFERMSIPETISEHTAFSGNVETMKWLISKQVPLTTSTMINAVLRDSNRKEMCAFLISQQCPFNEVVMKFAIDKGCFECVQLLRSHGCPWPQRKSWFKVFPQDLEILKWACANGYELDEDFVMTAASMQNFDALKWFLEIGFCNETDVAKAAIGCFEMEVFEWACSRAETRLDKVELSNFVTAKLGTCQMAVRMIKFLG